MKKKLCLCLSLTLCLVLSLAFGATSALAKGQSFDGNTELAVDSSLWQESWWTTNNKYATINENGILFDSYGTASAVAAVSLKESTPYSSKVTIVFNSMATGDNNGFLKIIFADNSQTPNGNAMKPWEIEGKAEHIALEINKNGVFGFHYNVGNKFGDGSAHPLTLQNNTKNYIDGADHAVVIDYESQTDKFIFNIKIDDTVIFDGNVATENLYCRHILTVGGYANSEVTDDLLIKSVKVLDHKKDPAPVIDKNNLLGNSENWLVAQNENVVFNSETATLNINGYTEHDCFVLKNNLPSEAKVVLKAQLAVPGEAQHKAVSRIILLENGSKKVMLSLDDDGNIWLLHMDLDPNAENGMLGSAGDWAPGILVGSATITITITPEIEAGDGSVFVSATAGGKTIGLLVPGFEYVTGNKLILTGGEGGSVVYTDVKVEDLVKEKEATAQAEKNLLENAGDWTSVASSITSEQAELAAGDYLVHNNKLPLNSTIEFTLNGTSDCNAWYYFSIGNFKSVGWDNEGGAGFPDPNARLRIVSTGSQPFFTCDVNGQAITTKTASTTLLYDGNDQHFKFVTVKDESGLKLEMYRNDVLEYSEIYAPDTAFGKSDGLYLTFRSTGPQNGNPIIKNVKCSYEEIVDVTAYNKGIALKREVYALGRVNPETASEQKTIANELKTKFETLDETGKAVVTNIAYCDYVIAEADKAIKIAEDMAKAQNVDNTIATLLEGYTEVTADNVSVIEENLENVKTLYNALTHEQKAYVTKYSVIENTEILLEDYRMIATDKAEAKKVDDLIAKAIVDKVTADNVETVKNALTAAKDGYNALTETQKGYVTKYGEIENVEKLIADYEKAGSEGASCEGCSGSLSSTLSVMMLAIICAVFVIILKKKVGAK